MSLSLPVSESLYGQSCFPFNWIEPASDSVIVAAVTVPHLPFPCPLCPPHPLCFTGLLNRYCCTLSCTYFEYAVFYLYIYIHIQQTIPTIKLMNV